jgi:hypothetical protein
MEELSEVAPSIAVARADAHSLRGIILAGSNAEAAEREFATALDQFSTMASEPAFGHSPDLHLRLGDLLLNLASLARTVRGGDGAARLLPRAISTYLDIVESMAGSPNEADARVALDTIAGVMPELREPDRSRLAERFRGLNARISTAAPRP